MDISKLFRNTVTLTSLACVLALSFGCGSRKPAQEPKDEGSQSEDGPEGNPFRMSGVGVGPSNTAPADGKSLVNEQGSRSLNAYDKQQVDILMGNKAKLVKANCGSSKDDNGQATGPWGKVSIRVMLGAVGHEKSVYVPPPHDSKPVGKCIIKAFTNLSFSPWEGADTEIDWDVELEKPEGAGVPPKKGKK
jgi:hypothetical protein